MKNKTSPLPETVSWQGPSSPHQKRSLGWYIGLSIISLLLIGFALYTRSIITLITFVLLVLVVFLTNTQPPHLTTYRLNKTGLSIDNVTYPYKTIKFFWIVYNPPHVKTLNFQTTAYINNTFSMQLANQDPVVVKFFLSQYLPEDLDREESVSEALVRRLKI